MTATRGVTPSLFRPAKRPSLQVLVLPLRDEDVLVPREVYFYKRRAHWAALAASALESLSIIVLSLLVIVGSLPAGSALLLVILVVAGLTVWRMIRSRHWSWADYVAIAVGIFLVLSAGVGLASLAVLAMFWAMGRFAVEAVRWRLYEVRYITNRRIIEINGLFGRRISSMPLHQVTDITLRRGVGGELFQYGELRIESAGQDQALGRIPYLLDDEKFHDVLVHLATNEKIDSP